MSTNEEKVYTEADFDNEMMEAINKRHNDRKTVEAGRTKEKTEEHKKMRNAAMCHYITRCALTVLVFLALYRATFAELIDPVLSVPATYIAATYLGWCACKAYGIYKKGANR